jgi:hypothetical protein
MSIQYYYDKYTIGETKGEAKIAEIKRNHSEIIQETIEFLRSKDKGEFVIGQEIYSHLKEKGYKLGNLASLHKIIRKSSCFKEYDSDRYVYWVLDRNIWNRSNKAVLI